MVKFKDDTVQRKRNTYAGFEGSSLVDDELDDMEPHDITSAEEPSNSLAQFANSLYTSFGSFDASTIICGHDSVTDDRVPFPKAEPDNGEYEQVTEEEMAVEWEGQEVQLVEQNDDRKERMPPPAARKPLVPDATSSVGFSSLGSCHSWLPEQFGSAASFFSGSRGNTGAGISSVGSMDMEYSAGAENFSLGGSLGGNSLTRVFENEAMEEPMSPNMNQRVLNQVPSWERSLRSKSPLSMASDDESLISKSSSKNGFASSHGDGDSMAWESRVE